MQRQQQIPFGNDKEIAVPSEDDKEMQFLRRMTKNAMATAFSLGNGKPIRGGKQEK
jgi:hypothetical protein